MYSCNTEPGFLQCAPESLGDVPVGLRLKKIQQRTAHQVHAKVTHHVTGTATGNARSKELCHALSILSYSEVSHCFSSTRHLCPRKLSALSHRGRLTMHSGQLPWARLPRCCPCQPQALLHPPQGAGSTVTLLPLSYTAWQSLAARFAIACPK